MGRMILIQFGFLNDLLRRQILFPQIPSIARGSVAILWHQLHLGQLCRQPQGQLQAMFLQMLRNLAHIMDFSIAVGDGYLF